MEGQTDDTTNQQAEEKIICIDNKEDQQRQADTSGYQSLFNVNPPEFKQ